MRGRYPDKLTVNRQDIVYENAAKTSFRFWTIYTQ
jgi:hypothetical protein